MFLIYKDAEVNNNFELIKKLNYDFLEANYIQALPSGQFQLREKTFISYLPRFIAKFIHWILYPNERVASISAIFNQYVKDLHNKKMPLSEDERMNLYINLSYINKRVIEMHNRTFLFWTRAPLIDVKTFKEQMNHSLIRVQSSLRTEEISAATPTLSKSQELQESSSVSSTIDDRPKVKVPLKELTAIPKEDDNSALFTQELNLLLNALTAFETENGKRRIMSLKFFTLNKQSYSLLKLAQQFLTHSGTEKATRTRIKALLNAFPSDILAEAAFLESCGNIWKGTAPPTYTAYELTKLEQLSKVPGMPQEFYMQLNLLQRMHQLKFHPKKCCTRSCIPFVDPMRKKAKHDAIVNLCSVGNLDDYEEVPDQRTLVQDWLLCKDRLQGSFDYAKKIPSRQKIYQTVKNQNTKLEWSKFVGDFAEEILSVKKEIYIPMIQSIWNENPDSKMIDSVSKLILLETNEVIFNLIQQGYPNAFAKKPDQILPTRALIEAITLVKNNLHFLWATYYPHSRKVINTNSFALGVHECIINLEFISNDAAAFTSKHLSETKEIVANILYVAAKYQLKLITKVHVSKKSLEEAASIALERRDMSNLALAHFLARVEALENSKPLNRALTPKQLYQFMKNKTREFSDKLIADAKQIPLSQLFRLFSKNRNRCLQAKF